MKAANAAGAKLNVSMRFLKEEQGKREDAKASHTEKYSKDLEKGTKVEGRF
jgi:hypothetical protein